MNKNKKIILIENQFTQFEMIRNYLKHNHYDVFPKIEDGDINEFKNFIDYIRYYLNPRYSDSARDDALKEIIKIIIREKPDLLILDYILVGNNEAENGISLASALYENNINIPVMFLSRMKETEEGVNRDLQRVKQTYEWTEKNYYDGNVLNEDYFRRHVLKIISKLFEKINYNEIKDDIEVILEKKIYTYIDPELEKRVKEILRDFKSKELISDNERKALHKLRNKLPFDDNAIKTFFSEIIQ